MGLNILDLTLNKPLKWSFLIKFDMRSTFRDRSISEEISDPYKTKNAIENRKSLLKKRLKSKLSLFRVAMRFTGNAEIFIDFDQITKAFIET